MLGVWLFRMYKGEKKPIGKVAICLLGLFIEVKHHVRKTCDADIGRLFQDAGYSSSEGGVQVPRNLDRLQVARQRCD